MILKAVRIDDRKGRRWITAYGVRGSNRKRLWGAEITGKSTVEVHREVKRNEDARMIIATIVSGVESVKGAPDDN